MNRKLAGLIVACIALASAAGGVILVRQAKAHSVPFFYVVGPLVVILGIGFSLLNVSLSDDALRRHFGGEENARRMREMWRGGWVGVLIGCTLIAAQYFLGSIIPLP